MTQVPSYQPAPPLTDDQARLWATLTHVAALVGILVGVGTLGWLGPLIILLVFRDRSAFVTEHARATLNFQITMAIVSVIAFFLWFVLIGFLITAAVYVVVIVFSIIGALAANRGQPYTYPLSIRFLR